MAGMRERIGNIGGKMKVTSSRGKGTRIEVIAPVLSDEVAARCRYLAGESGMVARECGVVSFGLRKFLARDA